ncbi:DUF1223 domain-containing protein [Roseibacterium beibuensis]|uniref:DUF1223 domain-containing protein n=1 Tax=[Roseibacterium] beibuensis TaxID=1193142 RepID=A0ABP9L240_9RHOB|nr:DUF1223 domain-containing protein [Roseibacterium beibuensis]MCS6621720.1 DUF1223 domain-containing protein [Roseibacterium beibuensis]
MRLTRSFAFLFAGFGIMASAASAQDGQPVVVELFTSQGCSSCPPADGLLGELASRDGVIALALHVDYWDYIGWADTFARPEFTQRQHGYGVAAGSNVVYTPQMVIGGIEHVVGFRPMQVADVIAEHARQPDPVAVHVEPDGDGFALTAEWRATPPAPAMVVQLVAYLPSEEVEITRGENAGRSVTYHNIVRDWQVVGEWDGAEPFSARLAVSEDMPHVVIVQHSGYGAILGAARVD